MFRAVAPEPVPKGVREVRDLDYGRFADEPDRGRLDLYLPPGEGPHPVLVFIHGGYWQVGGRGSEFGVYRRLGRRLAARGVLVLVPSYRLAPGHPFPAQIEDVARALGSIRSNVRAYGGDLDRVYVMGHSAGGHLTALAALDKRWLKRFGASPALFRGFISISGIYDVADLAAEPSGQKNVLRVFGTDRASWKRASPVEHVRDGPVPKIMLAIGERDTPVLRRQHEAMKRALEAAGAHPQTIEVQDRTHITIVTELFAEDDPLGEAVLRFMGARS